MEDTIRAEVEREYVVERGSWASERADRVTAALQQATPEEQRLSTLVVWLSTHAAFTAPGRTIYISRRLFEVLPTDDAAAFVVAHELAHHELGHVPPALASVRSVALLATRLAARWVHSQEHERDADLRAIELCVAAGYDPEACLVALDRLAKISLDYGSVGSVVDDDEALASGASHPPLRRRAADVRAHVDAMTRGHRVMPEVSARDADRRRRRRRVGMIAGGVVAAVAVALITRRPPGAT